uniref:Transcription repressor n=1 Tax=Opuntia streptacantha TaxID=393608 RepID=A0A7C9DLF1_OPUST
MSSSKKKVLLNTVSVSLGCSCRRPKLSSIFTPKPKSKIPKYQKHHNYLSHSSSTTSTSSAWGGKTVNSSPFDASTFSPYSSSGSGPGSTVDGFGRVGPRSVAVEKDSSDPYLDFRQSMLQMIVENDIYSKDELKHLLNCFLQLNSPSLHGIIIRAFTEIWNGFFFSERPSYSSPRFFVPKSYEI